MDGMLETETDDGDGFWRRRRILETETETDDG